MQMSLSIASLSAALAIAQGQLENAAKSSVNPAFRSKYADITSVLDAIRPVFSAQGLCVTQGIEDGGPDRIKVITLLSHKSGEYILFETSVPLTKKDAQGLGAAATYGRRYGLAAIAALGQEDDDGNTAAGRPPRQAAAKPQESGSVPASVGEPKADEAQSAPKTRAKKAKDTPLSDDDMKALQARFEAVKTKEDINPLVEVFTKLCLDDQTKILPFAQAARKAAGL